MLYGRRNKSLTGGGGSGILDYRYACNNSTFRSPEEIPLTAVRSSDDNTTDAEDSPLRRPVFNRTESYGGGGNNNIVVNSDGGSTRRLLRQDGGLLAASAAATNIGSRMAKW